MAILEDLTASIIDGDESKVRTIVQEAIKNKVSVKEILSDGLIGAMTLVGVKFKECEIFVPDVLMAARAMKAGMEILKPLFEKSGVQPVGKAVIGTVKGDLHDIGKNLVGMMVEGNGFEVIDLGVDVSPEKFVEAAKTNKADLCMMSALLTTTMPSMKETVDALKEAGLGGKVKTLIGGSPVTQSFAQSIGADGYGSNATAAVELAKALIARQP
jgi:5-methyltetrahydrofolate--homocysteine methyltransferase